MFTYKNHTFDEYYKSKITLKFIEKFKVIPFCVDNNRLILLYNDSFNFIIKDMFESIFEKRTFLVNIKKEDFDGLYNLVKAKHNTDEVLYSITNNSQVLELQEEQTNPYDIDVYNAPIVKLIDSFIFNAVNDKASDIHFVPTSKEIIIRYRIDGEIIDKAFIPLTKMNEISTRLKVMSNLDITKKMLPQDGKFIFKNDNVCFDIRISFMPTIYGEMISLRLLNNTDFNVSIEKLGFSDEQLNLVKSLINEEQGLILVTGPTGSGKSTTLHSCLLENVKRKTNIITVEDPVEYSIDGINQIQVNNESGLTFGLALRGILRQDPNIIMIGEIRDKETAEICLRASMTGHLVYSTLHTNSSFSVVSRLLDMGIDNFMIVDSLKGIITQRLVRLLCDSCKVVDESKNIEKEQLGISKDVIFYKACGCELCNKTGYSKRTSIYEVILFDDDFRELLIKKSPISKYEKLFNSKGLMSLKSSSLKLLIEGKTSYEEINNILNNKGVN